MSTTPTVNYGFSKITAGTEKDIWGPIQSTSLDGIDSAIKLRQDEAAAKLPLVGGTLTGKLILLTSIAGGAGLTAPHGVAPTAPVNGDIWTTTTDFFVRLNGTTVSFTRTGHTHVEADITNLVSDLAAINTAIGLKANAASPTITGTMTAAAANFSGAVTFAGTVALNGATTGITQTAGNSSTLLATTAFVAAAITAGGGIGADSVDNTKLTNMAANTIKGRITASTGDPEDLTAANVLTITGAATVVQVTDATTKEAEVAKSATYVLTAAEAGKMVTFNSASGVNCTINSSVFAAGHRVDVLQLGAGAVTFNGTATRRVFPGTATKLAGQYAGATIWFISATECVIIGNIIP